MRGEEGYQGEGRRDINERGGGISRRGEEGYQGIRGREGY